MADQPLPPSQRDKIDRYSPSDMRMDATGPNQAEELAAARDLAHIQTLDAAAAGTIRMDGMALYEKELMDGYANQITGLGDPSRDKTFGGRANGPLFLVRYITGAECQDRWRGSDLGARIVETIPSEMTRRGWSIQIQPEEGEFDDLSEEDSKSVAKHDGWPRLQRLLRALGVKRDEWPTAPSAAPTHKPGDLPHLGEDGTAIVEKIEKEQRRLKVKETIREALCYQRAYGGGAVFIGVDDGNSDLTTPLDMTKVKSIRHLTAYRGGWDGELVAWSWYNDPRDEKFGEPRIYMLRNLGVPISSPPAPGEAPNEMNRRIPSGPTGSLIFYIHESRFLLFPGQPVSKLARVQMRGWADSVFMRVDRAMSQFDQAWSGVSILMQEYSLPVMSVEGLAAMLASKTRKGRGYVAARAKAMQLAMSIAGTRMIDSKEKLERLSVPLAGVSDVLAQFWLRLAAAASMPVSMLMGQVQGGLGDASKGDVLFFYDQIAGKQDDEVQPQVERLTRIEMAAKEGPTKGRIPKRWSLGMNPLRQESADEKSKRIKSIGETDKTYIDAGVVTPEEVAATRFGGSEFNDGPIVLDMEARMAMAEQEAEPPSPLPADPNAPPPQGTPPNGPETPQGASQGQGGGSNTPSAPPPPQGTTDAADFMTRNGRTKVRTAVSVVAAFNGDGKLLFGKRRDSGKWSLPGGHAEPGEDPLSCAVRELHEETGFHPKRIALIGTKTVGGVLAQTHISLYRALVEGVPDASGDPDNEFAEFQWVDVSSGHYPEEIKANLHHDPDAIGPMLRRRR